MVSAAILKICILIDLVVNVTTGGGSCAEKMNSGHGIEECNIPKYPVQFLFIQMQKYRSMLQC
jgi:hypothetical protein